MSLPKDPEGLVTTVTRQVKAARSVHARVLTVAEDGSRSETEGDLRTDTPTPAAQLRISDQGVTHALMLDGVLYAREEHSEFEPGKPWMRVSQKEIAAAKSGGPAEYVKLLQAIDTIRAGAEQAMREISTDTGLTLVRKGRFGKPPVADQVDGVAAQRYEGTTSTEAMPGDEYARMRSAGLRDVPWKLWVDERGLPLKFEIGIASGKAGTTTTTCTYSKWGGALTLQPPPPAQVSVL
ncbi:hypothetical protein ACSNOI_34375 [Actinomadura kijaniata]|uniref:hypothetical protein n=1 Tax=Actinomadura kijaniata TaxID=46161 RepID=UPI003F1CB23F